MDAFRALPATARTTLGRHRERAVTDQSALHAVLDEALVCHLGVIVDGCPVVLPTGYGREGDILYLHGSAANRSLAAAVQGEVCVTVTLLDGLVCARSVFHNSMNYRSAVIFGRPRLVTGEAERLAALRVISEHLIPGCWEYARQPSRKALAATAVLALALDEASVKVRAGGPSDEEEDHALATWAGVLPVGMAIGRAEPDPLLPPGVPLPPHVAALQARWSGGGGVPEPGGPASRLER